MYEMFRILLLCKFKRLESLWTAVHVVTKRTRRVCEGDYYIYTKKWKPTVIVQLFRVIHQSKCIAKTKRIAYQDLKKSIGVKEKVVKV